MSNQQKASCTKCKRPCDGEAFVALKDGTTFHRFCFTCEICQTELPLKFALKNGKYYHMECYANAKATAPHCLKCDGPILATEISVVLGTDMRFHNRCFMCDSCQTPLTERFYSTAGQYYHEECVACSMCSVKLMGKNFSQLQDGGYICDNCLYSPQQQQQQMPAPPPSNLKSYNNNKNNGSSGSLNQGAYAYGQPPAPQQQPQYGGNGGYGGGYQQPAAPAPTPPAIYGQGAGAGPGGYQQPQQQQQQQQQQQSFSYNQAGGNSWQGANSNSGYRR